MYTIHALDRAGQPADILTTTATPPEDVRAHVAALGWTIPDPAPVRLLTLPELAVLAWQAEHPRQAAA